MRQGQGQPITKTKTRNLQKAPIQVLETSTGKVSAAITHTITPLLASWIRLIVSCGSNFVSILHLLSVCQPLTQVIWQKKKSSAGVICGIDSSESPVRVKLNNSILPTFSSCVEARLSIMAAMKLCTHMLQDRGQTQVLIYGSRQVIPTRCLNTFQILKNRCYRKLSEHQYSEHPTASTSLCTDSCI